MPLRCVYTDLDGTLLGAGGSLFHDADGKFTLLGARALEACARAGAEVVIKSGRRKETVAANARLLGQTSFIYEVGAGMVIDGEETLLTGEVQPADGKTIYELIEESGAPRLLFEHFDGRLEYHDPWHLNRDISHLLRGTIDVGEANELLEQNGLGHLRLVDNQAAQREFGLVQGARRQHETLGDRDPFGVPRTGGALEVLHHRVNHQTGVLAHRLGSRQH